MLVFVAPRLINKMQKINTIELSSFANNMRINYLKMIYGSREALIPSVFSIMDIFAYLYKLDLILHKESANNLVISKGHSASIIYPFLIESNRQNLIKSNTVKKVHLRYLSQYGYSALYALQVHWDMALG